MGVLKERRQRHPDCREPPPRTRGRFSEVRATSLGRLATIPSSRRPSRAARTRPGILPRAAVRSRQGSGEQPGRSRWRLREGVGDDSWSPIPQRRQDGESADAVGEGVVHDQDEGRAAACHTGHPAGGP